MRRPRIAPALLVPLGLLLGATSAAAQVATEPSVHHGTPVVFEHDTLLTLYARLGPFGHAERALAVEQRLDRLARSLGVGGDSITVVEVEQRSELTVGDQVLMTVLDDDAAPTGQARPALALAYAARIQGAVSAAAHASSPRSLTVDAAKATAATAILLLVLLGLRFLFRRAHVLLHGPLVPPLRIKNFELLSARRLGRALAVLTRALRIVFTVVLFYFYVPLVLSFFPWTAPYARTIISYVVTPLTSVWVGFIDYIPKVFFIAVIVLVTRYFIKAVHLVFEAIEHGGLKLEGFQPDWAPPTYNIVRFLIIVFAVVVMFPYLPGSGSDAFKGISVFVGVLFSFGSSGAVGNIVAGVVLTYTSAFQVGDRVRIGNTEGDVEERTLLVTRLRTIKNVEITIPNGAVLASHVVNYSSQGDGHPLILHQTITIGYDVPWRQVHELLISAARASKNIVASPVPFVLQTSLDDSYVSYEINAYTDAPAKMALTYSSLHQNIQDQFNKAGVEIMSPHYGALRDGNTSTVPAEHLSKGTREPAFRVIVDQSGEGPK